MALTNLSGVIHMIYPCHNFSTLHYVRQKLTLTFSIEVTSPAWVIQVMAISFLLLIFDVIFAIIFLEMHPIFNRIQRFKNFGFTQQLFIQTFII